MTHLDPARETPRTADNVPMPTIGRVGLYRTDGRNGLVYDLASDVIVTRESHPGDYPCRYCERIDVADPFQCPERKRGQACDRPKNPLMVPDEGHVHLLVKTPGGFGTQVFHEGEDGSAHIVRGHGDQDFVGAPTFSPGSGTYVELNVPVVREATPRSWRWPL